MSFVNVTECFMIDIASINLHTGSEMATHQTKNDSDTILGIAAYSRRSFEGNLQFLTL